MEKAQIMNVALVGVITVEHPPRQRDDKSSEHLRSHVTPDDFSELRLG
jgi:hypothetical protein